MYDCESLQLPGNPVVNLILPSSLAAASQNYTRLDERV